MMTYQDTRVSFTSSSAPYDCTCEYSTYSIIHSLLHLQLIFPKTWFAFDNKVFYNNILAAFLTDSINFIPCTYKPVSWCSFETNEWWKSEFGCLAWVFDDLWCDLQTNAPWFHFLACCIGWCSAAGKLSGANNSTLRFHWQQKKKQYEFP